MLLASAEPWFLFQRHGPLRFQGKPSLGQPRYLANECEPQTIGKCKGKRLAELLLIVFEQGLKTELVTDAL